MKPGAARTGRACVRPTPFNPPMISGGADSMTFLPRGFGLPIRRVCACGLVVVISCVAAAASEATAARPPRAERIATRRLERIEVLERRAEAAAEMPPRPADVRRLLRRGVPLSEIMPQPPAARSGSAPAAAAARRPATAATRGATPPQPVASAPRGPATTPPRALAPAPAPTTAAAPPAAEPPLRFPEQPAVAQESMPAAANATTGVTPATAIDDGTRSVLVREEPTPAPPAELLPTPQPK
jgi:hypothetical protein